MLAEAVTAGLLWKWVCVCGGRGGGEGAGDAEDTPPQPLSLRGPREEHWLIHSIKEAFSFAFVLRKLDKKNMKGEF